jgi:succinylglutamate desuccinylase
MSLAELLPMTLAGEPPAEPVQRLENGVVLRWLAEGVVQIDPPVTAVRCVLLSAGIHGNETAPVEWLERLLRAVAAGLVIPRLSVLLVFGNPGALRAGTRFVEYDLNRLFNAAHRRYSGAEAERARLLECITRAFFEGASDGLHYDLHTAIRGSRFEKFALYPWQPDRPVPLVEWQRLGQAGIEALLTHRQSGHTFAAFTFESLCIQSFTLELGKARPFGANAALDLTQLERMIVELLEDRPLEPPATMPLRYRVMGDVIKHSDAFKLHLERDTENFTALPQGSLLAEDGDRHWYVEQPSACILFPNPGVANGQRAGLIVVRSDDE